MKAREAQGNEHKIKTPKKWFTKIRGLVKQRKEEEGSFYLQFKHFVPFFSLVCFTQN